MKKIFSAILCLAATFLIAGCSSDMDETLSNAAYSFDELTFDVSVSGKSGFGGNTRAYNNKTSWADGDVIYFTVDGNDANTCKITYNANSQWTVEKLSKSASFAKEKGTLTAIYAEKSSYSSTGGITTSGDVIYTTSGSYTKYGTAVHISLNMNSRPQSRITINGIGSGFTLSGKSFNGVTSLSNVSWTTTNGITAYDVTGQNATYFGLIEPNADNTTTVTLTDEETAVEYYRTYSKRMTAGEAIVINGPLSNEASEWTKIVSVTSLSLNKTEISMIVGEETDITASILPTDATNKNLKWKISDTSIATITMTGNVCHVKTLAKGDVTVTAETESGAKTATCKIHVGEIADFVTSTISSFSMTSLSGYKYISFGLTIKNNLASQVVLKGLKLTDESTSSTLKNFTFGEDIATLAAGESKTYSIPINGTYASYFGFTTTFTYGGSTYTTQCSYNVEK